MLNGDRSDDESSEEEKEYLNTETKRNAKLICILLRGRRVGEGWRIKGKSVGGVLLWNLLR